MTRTADGRTSPVTPTTIAIVASAAAHRSACPCQTRQPATPRKKTRNSPANCRSSFRGGGATTSDHCMSSSIQLELGQILLACRRVERLGHVCLQHDHVLEHESVHLRPKKAAVC